MRLLVVVLIGVLVGVGLYVLLFPRNKTVGVSGPGGRTFWFSRTGVSVDAAPDRFRVDGMSHIAPYIGRLLVPSTKLKFLQLFTPDGTRGLGLTSRNGVVSLGLTVEWRKEPQREAAIRAFFTSLGVVPSEDYLAGNGGVPNATRILEFPIRGGAAELTTLTKRVLEELCGVSPKEALEIKLREK